MPLGIDGLPPRHGAVPDVTNDLVVVVPGIMGSALHDRDAGRDVWGLKDLRWYGRAWSSKSGLDALALSDAERDRLADGCYDPQTARVTATGLLEFPAALPFLDGMEPYTNLLKRLRTVVADPAAIVTFPYDWRLPVTVNSRLLAARIGERLRAWRQHPKQLAASALHQGRPPRVVIVAHSMVDLSRGDCP